MKLRKAYQRRVAALAAKLAPRFRAREFDPRARLDDDDLPFLRLEELCQELPICRYPAAAKLVIAVSPYAHIAAYVHIESCVSHPCDGTSWQLIAAWCLARDVQDEAIRRGSARPIERRIRIETHEEEGQDPEQRPTLELVSC